MQKDTRKGLRAVFGTMRRKDTMQQKGSTPEPTPTCLCLFPTLSRRGCPSAGEGVRHQPGAGGSCIVTTMPRTRAGGEEQGHGLSANDGDEWAEGCLPTRLGKKTCPRCTTLALKDGDTAVSACGRDRRGKRMASLAAGVRRYDGAAS